MRQWALAALLLLLGCGGGAEEPQPSESCVPHAGDPPSASGVSFRANVMPLFAESCALVRYCHAETGTSQGDLYLGPSPVDPEYPPDEATIATVRAALVNAPSVRAVSMARITPGSPAQSFLMHKVDADQNCAGILCEDPLQGEQGTALCGDKMPPGKAPPLPAAQADLIRAWILEGAQDN